MMITQPPELHGHHFARRVIIHVDLDCFYCQVEQKRLQIPADVPCAVQQWEGLIAVNYAARAAGITRHMRVAEAKKHCPQLRLVHVQTIGGNGNAQQASSPQAAESVANHAVSAEAAAGDTASEAHAADRAAEDVEGSAADRASSKASLQRYRRASADIMRLLAQISPGCPFEKASIDEAYLDATHLAGQELATAESADGGVPDMFRQAAEGSTVLGEDDFQSDLDFDRLAAAGAVIALRLRAAVLDRLGFTCSAGIGPNKLLAKIGSAKNKPNKQTVVLPRAIEGLMQALPLGKVKGLGGKLGSKLESLGAATAGDAAALSWEALVDAFGSKARWVWETVRGIDEEAVTPKSLVKSINSCKSFSATSDATEVSRWLGVLAAELAERLAEDEADNSRRTRTLVLQYRVSSGRNAPDRSIRGAIPGSTTARDSPSQDSLAAAALALFNRITPAPYPLVRLALAATDFVDLPGSGGNMASSAALARFLATGAQQQTQQQHKQEHQPAPQGAHQHHSKKHPQSQQQPHLEHFFAGPRAAKAAPRASNQPDQSGHHEQAQEHVPQQQQQDPQQQQQQQQQPALHHQEQVPQGQHDAQQLIHQEEAPLASRAIGTVQQHQLHQGQEHFSQQQQATEQHQQPGSLQQQPEELSPDELVAIAGVDVAEQARILRDIEVQGMLRRSHQQRAAPGARGANTAGSKRRKSTTQQPGSGKQMRISSMFGSKDGS